MTRREFWAWLDRLPEKCTPRLRIRSLGDNYGVACIHRRLDYHKKLMWDVKYIDYPRSWKAAVDSLNTHNNVLSEWKDQQLEAKQ